MILDGGGGEIIKNQGMGNNQKKGKGKKKEKKISLRTGYNVLKNSPL